LRTNTRSVAGDTLILGAVLEGTVFDLGAISWDGATFNVIGTNAISADTTVATYESFEMEFDNFGTPEYTCEVELSGTADTQNWTQLDWTADLSFSTSNVATTLQLYDYTASQYPTSGDGYMADTIGQTDTTRNQTITTTPANFRDANGNWRMRITGAKITETQFELRVDWAEYKVTASEVYRLRISNDYAIDLATYPRDYVDGIEVLIRYNSTEDDERWFLRAYNWATASFSDAAFNNTAGSEPTLNEWEDYAIAVTDNWTDYFNDSGVIRIEFFDEGLTANQTAVEVDFVGIRAIIDGTQLDLKNTSPLSLHVVAIWITNSSIHQRHSANFFMNSGEPKSYIRADVSLPQSDFLAKVITERGNTAVFSNG
jgi:hypothetical protein